MRIILALAALFVLAGCEHMDFTTVSVSSGYSHHYYPSSHISYTLGFYTGNYYNGYRVYGSHGHRYYHAPRYYSHHRHFARPVVVQHVHVHTSYCEHTVRPRDNHRQRDSHRQRNSHTQAYVQPQVRNTPRSEPTRRRQPRTTPPRQRENRTVNNNQREERVVNNDRRENRQDRRRDQKRKRK